MLQVNKCRVECLKYAIKIVSSFDWGFAVLVGNPYMELIGL